MCDFQNSLDIVCSFSLCLDRLEYAMLKSQSSPMAHVDWPKKRELKYENGESIIKDRLGWSR